MPFPPEQKRKSRAQILQSARKLFNQYGFLEVSIDKVMEDAGLTRGGFYNHFDSKEDLFAATLADFASNREAEVAEVEEPLPELARQVIQYYVSKDHQGDFAHQCPLIALPSDVARASAKVKRVYERVLRALVAMFEKNVDAKGKLTTREQSLALAASCVGAMVLSKTVQDDDFSEEIRSAVIRLSDGMIEG